MSARPYAKTEQIITTLKPADRDRLDALAAAREVSRAEVVRTFVLAGLDAADPGMPKTVTPSGGGSRGR